MTYGFMFFKSVPMSLQKLIEDTIKEAITAGEFNNLPGKGKPLDLDDYFKAPEEMRMCFGLLKSNDFIPPEVELFREIEELKAKLTTTPAPENAAELKNLIQQKTVRLSLMTERLKQQRSHRYLPG